MKTFFPFKLFIFLSPLMFFTNCATLFSSKTQMITITSEPPEASIYIDGTPMGKTPLSIPMERDIDSIILKKDGYKPKYLYTQKKKIKIYIKDEFGILKKEKREIAPFHSKINGWYLVNMIWMPTLLAPIFMFVDIASGTALRLPTRMGATLESYNLKTPPKATMPNVQQNNSPPKSKSERLIELKEMLDKKLITQDDYNKEKREILDE